MNIKKETFYHLLNNLERKSFKDSIFNYESGRKAFLSLGKGNIDEWLETLLPNTRLILEPKINGISIAIRYINGTLNKAINENSLDITKKVNSLRNIPKFIPFKKRIEIRGVLYKDERKSDTNIKTEFMDTKKTSIKQNELYFCAFHIFHCRINQFKSLQELKKLNFEIPETEFTNLISDVEIYRQCWKEGKLFTSFPTSGIVVKINSKKLQKHLEENNLTKHWAYAIN
tara:strand:+ start:6190 stop:6876 length:687 start_codon:yes stop_codon:yes gene_type:complete